MAGKKKGRGRGKRRGEPERGRTESSPGGEPGRLNDPSGNLGDNYVPAPVDNGRTPEE